MSVVACQQMQCSNKKGKPWPPTCQVCHQRQDEINSWNSHQRQDKIRDLEQLTCTIFSIRGIPCIRLSLPASQAPAIWNFIFKWRTLSITSGFCPEPSTILVLHPELRPFNDPHPCNYSKTCACGCDQSESAADQQSKRSSSFRLLHCLYSLSGSALNCFVQVVHCTQLHKQAQTTRLPCGLLLASSPDSLFKLTSETSCK